jgi:hypothetical protein
MLPPDLERASPRRVYRPVGRERWYLAGLLLTAVAFSVGILWRRAEQGLGFPSHDIYAYFYPNFVYALQSLRAGSGLLWNPYQDCGQPFFANSQTGLLYPVNLVFLLLPREPALVTAIILNLTIAGAGIFLLCRQLELHLPAALGAAAVFQFGGAALQLASWSPIHLGAYVWLPVAMWATERLIAHPTRRAAVLLGVVLAIQILPGFPQITFFTYQLIALRVLWAVAVGPAPQRAALIAAAALGLALPVLLAAVQFVPSLEVARESMRTGRLPNNQLGDPFTLHLGRRVLQDFTWRNGGVLIALAALPWMWNAADRRRRSDVAFYACAALLHFLLALGPGMPLFDLYALLPVTTTFRGIGRLLWVSNFAIAVSPASASSDTAPRPRGRSAIVACIIAGAVALQVLALGGIGAADWILAAGLVAAGRWRSARPWRRGVTDRRAAARRAARALLQRSAAVRPASRQSLRGGGERLQRRARSAHAAGSRARRLERPRPVPVHAQGRLAVSHAEHLRLRAAGDALVRRVLHVHAHRAPDAAARGLVLGVRQRDSADAAAPPTRSHGGALPDRQSIAGRPPARLAAAAAAPRRQGRGPRLREPAGAGAGALCAARRRPRRG